MNTDFRQRLFDALEASIAVGGYPRTTIADIVGHARTSRRTFYEHFTSKDDCFPARQLQHDAMANFIAMVQSITDSEAFRSSGVAPVSPERIITLLGGLRELTAMTLENGGRMSDVAEEAVDATIALVGPRN